MIVILSNHKPNAALRLDEKNAVEKPFLSQVKGLGWRVIRLEQQPVQGFRTQFGEVVLARVLNMTEEKAL
jgi:type I restriction enzyme, R subunit